MIMALFQGNFFSKSILNNVSVNVILPLPDEGGIQAGNDLEHDAKYPTLYLLHGAYGDATDWIRNTRIEVYAQQYQIAVVMASAGNSFYMDMPYGPAYGQFFERELINFAESVFPLSRRREDRFVAGLSMGGYGALRLAFLHPENYAAAAALSGAFDLKMIGERLEAEHKVGSAVYGMFTQMNDNEWNLAKLAQKAQCAGKELPRLMMSCGSEDFTLEMNHTLKEQLAEQGIAVHYEEHPGEHNWDYWETHIQRVLAWLPIRTE